MVPLYKSVMAAFDAENPTTLLAERLRDYRLDPVPNGRVAALTIAYNEHVILPLWARYYAKQFGAENVFIIDQGSNPPYDGLLPSGVNVIRVPRDAFDNWQIVRLVALQHRFLLESYDAVLYTDSDEFVCASPEALRLRNFQQFILELPDPIGITRGYDLHHDLESEVAYDPSKPVLQQRRFIKYNPMMDKPVISRVPLNWIPGFHRAREGGVRVPGLYLLHLRWFDLDQALRKGVSYRTSKWEPYDLEKQLGSYQRDEDDQVVGKFKGWSRDFARVKDAINVDLSSDIAQVPNWMRESIFI